MWVKLYAGEQLLTGEIADADVNNLTTLQNPPPFLRVTKVAMLKSMPDPDKPGELITASVPIAEKGSRGDTLISIKTVGSITPLAESSKNVRQLQQYYSGITLPS